MNSTALITMLGLVIGWAILAGAAVVTGRFATLTFLILTLTALYLYVPWVRLRASGLDGSSRPVRFWTKWTRRWGETCRG